MRVHRRFLLGVLVVTILSIGCRQTAVPTVVADVFLSGGLGLSRSDWEKSHIETGKTDFLVIYDNGKYTVTFYPDSTDNVDYIKQTFVGKLPTLADARDLTRNLFPQDAKLVQTYRPDLVPTDVVDLYMSESLVRRFDPADPWSFPNGEPGSFIAINVVVNGRVKEVIIGTGNDY